MKSYIQQRIHSLQFQKKKFLLAVSGGVDSMVLLHIFHKLKVEVAVAHINYGFRAEASDAETDLVQQYCQAHNIPIYIKRKNGYDDLAIDAQQNLQAYARKVRYDFFKEIQNQLYTYDILVTAHHANDQVETVLMNLAKGTGINGLKGIQDLHHNIWRPLLHYGKDEIYAYAAQHQIPFLEDASNHENKYLRNTFRNTIIPTLESAVPNATKNILATINRLQHVSKVYNQYITQKLQSLLTQTSDHEAYVSISTLQRQSDKADLIFSILDKYGMPASMVPEFEKLLIAKQASTLTFGNIQCIRDKDLIHIRYNDTGKYLPQVISQASALSGIEIVTDWGKYNFQIIAADQIDTLQASNIFYIDCSNLSFPLLLRQPKPGDYFYPLGLNKKKKVAKFLIDNKVPVHLRASSLVLCSEDVVLAVLPYRIHHKYKVQPSTTQVLKVIFTST